uniref:F-box protein PP2-B15 n=2 Tax=Anthurium amnicola TaxID=1678845 RepID=A0A1D1YIJ3_9ARAE
MERRDEEVIHPTTGGLSSRSSLSSSHSWSQDSSFDYRDFPPQSEVEEIPSKRWRRSLFPSRGRSTRSSPTVQPPAAVGLRLAGSHWEQRLPPDYKQILARATSPVEASSYQELYYRLCASILIDDGKKSFSIDEMTGKKCYMLSARDLEFQNHSPLWIARSLPRSRFSEVAQLELREWSGALCIVGKMDVKDLSPQTTYAAHLVYKPLSWYTFPDSRLPHGSFRASITVVRQASTSRRRSLISEEGKVMSRRSGRGGWMEKVGDFIVDVGQQPLREPLRRVGGSGTGGPRRPPR